MALLQLDRRLRHERRLDSGRQHRRGCHPRLPPRPNDGHGSPLRAFGAALANIPANQVERVKTDYATVELTDAANLHGIEVLDYSAPRPRQTSGPSWSWKRRRSSTADEMNTHIAVLKMNRRDDGGAGEPGYESVARGGAGASRLRSRSERDAEVAEIADRCPFRRQGV
ncbi:MAG: hypothetical protein R2748_23635 [Bryobacterales bacterium]